MRAWAVVCLLLSVALAGCGGDEDGAGGYVTPERDDDGTYVVLLRSDRSFEPDKIEVPGDAIVSFHAEIEGCDVRSQESGGPDSHGGKYANGLIPNGGSYNWAAPEEGEFHLYCTLHEDNGMTAVLRVG